MQVLIKWLAQIAFLTVAGASVAQAQSNGIGNVTATSATGFPGIVQDCTEIVSVPVTITVPGHYCLKRDLSYSLQYGSAILIEANHVTINLNGFKLGGLAGGPTARAIGISSYGQRNIIVRNGTVRGFFYNVALGGSDDSNLTTGHIVENVRSENARSVGISVSGWRAIVRDNFIVNTTNSSWNSMIGIEIFRSRGSVVSDNVISGVLAETAATGIVIRDAEGVLIDSNKIYDLEPFYSRAINSMSGSHIVVNRNIISNLTFLRDGVNLENTTSDVCLDNLALGSGTAYVGCEAQDGNQRN